MMPLPYILANRGLGVGILRMFYLFVIRSLFDYVTPVLVQFSTAQLCPLELIQNEAMHLILGCPRMAKIEIVWAEMNRQVLLTGSVILPVAPSAACFELVQCPLNRY